MLNHHREAIQKFLSATAFAVAGASVDRHKFGNKVLRCYIEHHKKVYPLHPTENRIEDLACIHHIEELPKEVTSLSIITPPPVTEKIVTEALRKGIQHIWMQPGAESSAAIKLCQEQGLTVIAYGPCLLVELGFNG